MKRILLLLVIGNFLSIGIAAAFQERPPVRKNKAAFGIILNEDGDLAFVSPDPQVSERMLRANVDGHATLGINTYVFCVGSGSDVLYYPTKVSSTVGWRKTKYEEENPVWRARTESARKSIAAGLDAVQIAGSQAKKNHMLFIPSLRMNDSHFMTDPYNYPLTGKFWLDHTDLTIKDSPIVFSKDYGNLLDYTHKEVRDFRLAVFEEVLTRNKAHMDGFELDFNRTQIFFPKGKSEAGAPLMTALVRTVRKRLDALSRETGRPMYLFVRIPPSEESCKWAGLDVETWMKEGLVDLISPSQLMTLAHDMPIERLTKLAHRYGVKMYPSLYPRNSFRVPFNPAAPDLGLKGKMDRAVTLPEALGAAANYRWMGADGFYLFNYYSFPHPESMYPLVAALKTDRPNVNEKVFAITKTYYHDDKEPSYAYVKQLPKKVNGTAAFSILVGELPQASVFPVSSCVFRLGLKKYTGEAPEVTINGTRLNYQAEAGHSKAAQGKSLPPDMAERTLIYPINDLSCLKRGQNQVRISVNDATISDIEIGYAYFNNLSKIMVGTAAPAMNSGIKLNHINKTDK